MYSTVLTPVTMIAIPNTFSAVLRSGPLTSRYPTVVTVVIVMYIASMNDRPNRVYPIVPATKTASTMAIAKRRRPIVDLTCATVLKQRGAPQSSRLMPGPPVVRPMS